MKSLKDDEELADKAFANSLWFRGDENWNDLFWTAQENWAMHQFLKREKLNLFISTLEQGTVRLAGEAANFVLRGMPITFLSKGALRKPLNVCRLALLDPPSNFLTGPPDYVIRIRGDSPGVFGSSESHLESFDGAPVSWLGDGPTACVEIIEALIAEASDLLKQEEAPTVSQKGGRPKLRDQAAREFREKFPLGLQGISLSKASRMLGYDRKTLRTALVENGLYSQETGE